MFMQTQQACRVCLDAVMIASKDASIELMSEVKN
jgi:hypothetical protein